MNSKRAKVSIITSTYNNVTYISQAIESVLAQTYDNWEMLIVDDGSSDGTEDVVTRFNDSRIHYFTLEHSGIPAVPRNIGIEHSTGEFIAFLDADDMWLPQKLEKQVAYLKANPKIALVYGLAKTFGFISRVIYMNSGHSGKIFNKLIEANFIPCLTVILRSSVLKEVGGFDEDEEIKFAEDWELWLKIAHKYNIGFVPEVLGCYRMHEAGHSHDERHIQRSAKVIDKIIKKGWISEKKVPFIKAQLQFNQTLKILQQENKKKLLELFWYAFKELPTFSQKVKAIASIWLAFCPKLRKTLFKWRRAHRKSFYSQ